MAGLDLDPWQQWVLTRSLGERADGKWANFGVGVCVPRQNGKGGLLEARELAGLFLLGERLIIHSAHQFDTSQEAFERLVALVEGTPELSKRLAKRGVSRSHGSEGIRLKNGQRIRFRTRTKGGGRGFTGDCLILDEAMILPDAFIGAVLPVLSARPNPQVWYTGSAVDQTIHEHGLVFTRVRERGIKGDDPRLFYAEWSAADSIDDVTIGMAEDPAMWALANPALGIRISAEYIEAERREFASNTRGFAVERMGAGDWPKTTGPATVIDLDTWNALADKDSDTDGPFCFAFDVTPSRDYAAIAVSGPNGHGGTHLELVEHLPGTEWVAARLAGLVKRLDPLAVLYDVSSPAASLAPDLEAAGVTVTEAGPRDLAKACGSFFDAVTEGQVSHLGQPGLLTALTGAGKRDLADAWAWSRRKSGTDISPLIAATLAHWGTRTQTTATPQVWSLDEVVANLRRRRQEANA